MQFAASLLSLNSNDLFLSFVRSMFVNSYIPFLFLSSNVLTSEVEVSKTLEEGNVAKFLTTPQLWITWTWRTKA